MDAAFSFIIYLQLLLSGNKQVSYVIVLEHSFLKQFALDPDCNYMAVHMYLLKERLWHTPSLQIRTSRGTEQWLAGLSVVMFLGAHERGIYLQMSLCFYCPSHGWAQCHLLD